MADRKCEGAVDPQVERDGYRCWNRKASRYGGCGCPPLLYLNDGTLDQSVQRRRRRGDAGESIVVVQRIREAEHAQDGEQPGLAVQRKTRQLERAACMAVASPGQPGRVRRQPPQPSASSGAMPSRGSMAAKAKAPSP